MKQSTPSTTPKRRSRRAHEVAEAMRNLRAGVNAAQTLPEALEKFLDRLFPGTKKRKQVTDR
jgi:hypothetical protein